MGRFKQRLAERMSDPEFVKGYDEVDAELSLIAALDKAREKLNITQLDLSKRMKRKQPAVARILSSSSANPTLDTLVDLLKALGLSAKIELHLAKPKEPLLKVVTKL